MSTTWISNGAASGGSGPYVAGTQSVRFIHDNFAVDGDTIAIPDGNYTWASEVDITKAITVRAQNMPTDARVTKSNVNITHGGASTYLIAFAIGSGGNSELAGINFLPGSGGNTQSYVQFAQGGASPPAKVGLLHDCTFNIPNFQLLNAVAWWANGGVIYRNRFFGSTGANQGSGSGALLIKQAIPWSNQDTFGTADTTGTSNVYIEDNIFDNLYSQAIDGDDNCRLTIRNNVLNNSQVLTHGVTSLAGGRLFEFYNNTCNYYPVDGNLNKTTASGQTPDNGGVWPNMIRWIWIRAGTARIHDNTFQQIFSYGYYQTAPAFMFSDESLTRSGPNQGFQKDWDYPGWHWAGVGGKDIGDTTLPPSYQSYQLVDPVYCWNNTYSGAGAQPVANQWGCIDYSGYGQDTAAPIVRNGTLANGSKIVTALSQTSDLNVNQPVTGNNLPAGTVIASKDSASQITLNNAATGAGVTSLSFGINATADVFLLNRDLFINTVPPVMAGGIPGNYTTYAYPHPARSGAIPPPPSGGGSGSGSGTMNPPFQPMTFVDIVPKGGWNTYTGPQEDGPSKYAPVYTGQSQTKIINSAQLPPPTTPTKNTLPGAAPPSMSKIP